MQPVVPPKEGTAPIIGVFALLIALLVAVLGTSLVQEIAWSGLGAALGAGAVIGVAVASIVLGGSIAVKKRPRWPLILGLLFGVTALFAWIGPPWSRASKKDDEEKRWNDLVQREATADVNPYGWDDYERKVPPMLQRPEREARRAVARALMDDRSHDLGDLRRLLSETSGDDGKARFAEARGIATKALAAAYSKGVAKLRSAPLPVDGSDVPMDPNLRKAFAAILDDLASAPSSLVHIDLALQSDLTPPKGADAALQRARKVLAASHRGPVADTKVIDIGGALLHERARLGTFMVALDESFKAALDPDLLTFTFLPRGGDRRGKLVLVIVPKVTRTADYTPLDTSTEGKDDSKVSGFLFGLEAHWRFAILDREGQELYRSDDIVTAPATKIHADTGAHDPDWAMYSVLLDSIYYGFSRQLTGRFGLPPPAPKESFKYEP